MRLVDPKFRFCPDGAGLKVCRPGSTRALARIVPDESYPAMWRVVRADGRRSDMVNRTRAKDIAWGIPESIAFIGEQENAA